MRFVEFRGYAAIAVLFVAGCNGQPSPNQTADLDGEWSVVAMHGQGHSATPAELDGMRWSVSGREIVGTNPDGSSGIMSFALDHSTTPQRIDITALDGNRKGETDAGIYMLDGHRLRICLAEEGNGRPDEFRAGPESWIMELERVRR
jgi:uncharacterized protein (TIGR03067 family)